MKKFGKLLICLGLSASFIFTGCSLVQRNTERYLNREVASLGEISISKQELISAYNSYGYQYTQYYGYTAEKALKTVIDNLINRKIVLNKAKESLKFEDDGTVSYVENGTKVATLYNKNVWYNEIWTDVFESVNSQIKNYEDSIKKANGQSTEAETEEEAKPAFNPYSEYEKKVVYENETWSKVVDEIAEAQEDRMTIANFVQNKTGDDEISLRAFGRYIKNLEHNYKSLNLTVDSLKTVSKEEFNELYKGLQLTDSQKVVFLYELERIYTIYEENKIIEDFQDVYNQYMQKVDADVNKKIVDYYKELVENSYEKYAVETNADGYTAYVKAMQNDSSKVYYHKDYGTNDKGEKKAFVAVSHVLIKLSDEQISELKELKSQRDSSTITAEEYDEKYQQVLDKTVVKVRDEDGFETDETKTVAEVRAEIEADLAQYTTVEEKAVAFNKYIYKYGQDTGMINASKYYVVNTDTEVEDKMVKEFADEARRLAVENEDGGNLGEAVLHVDLENEKGYSGYHIIFNAGIVKNDLTIEQVRNMEGTEADALYLYNKKIMLGTNKTVYDYIYDTIYSSEYSTFEKSIINTAKDNAEVVYYVSAYSDLY